MEQFGRAALLAAIAFALYGLLGQTFVRASLLPPSTVVNQDLFLRTFGFPIQLLRAGAAVVSAWAVIRFLRSFEVETQRKIATLQEAQLHEAQRREALRGELLKQIVSAQEAERQRIARELHDVTGQSLTAIGLGLRGISHTLRQDTDKAAENVRQLEGFVARTLDELQHLIADLRPSHLDDLGLPAALRWYAGEVQNRVPLSITVDINGEPCPIDPAANTALFRVAQEALTNVVKHAQATKATVRLSYLPNVVILQVEDDGCGFDVRAQTQRPAWGLLGMEERATLLGGHVTIQSQPGRGAQIEMMIPYHPKPEVSDDDAAVARG
jgi:signal transduction histidine kinase